MYIGGLIKLSLSDYPGQVACTVFTAGCNFRCPFCHNPELVLRHRYPEPIDRDAFFEFLEQRRGRLDAVCISGGEPLMQFDIEVFIQRIKSLGYLVKLDTNGSFPQRLQNLLDRSLLDYVAMDLKNSPLRYGETVGLSGFDTDKVLESLNLLRHSGIAFECRTTVIRELHTADDLLKIAQLIAPCEHYYLQSFRDNGFLLNQGDDPLGDGMPSGLHPYSDKEMRELLDLVRQVLPGAELRG